MTREEAKTFLVTGGIGFIGSWYCDEILSQNPDNRVICIDKLTYCTSPRTVDYLTSKYGNQRFELIIGDICDTQLITRLRKRLSGIDYDIVHFAAESLVDNSFDDPGLFVRTNVTGTLNLLELVRSTIGSSHVPRLIHMSTDEVYGEQLDCNELNTPLQPTTPYSASKASAELLVSAYATSWRLPTQIIRCSNVYGPRQYPEKIVPILCADLAALPCKPFTLHGSGLNKRRYIYITDAIDAIEIIRRSGEVGGIYNVGTGEECEMKNVDLARMVTRLAGENEDELVRYGPDRQYNDAQYNMDCTKIKQLGWSPRIGLEDGLKACLKWAKQNPDWFINGPPNDAVPE